MLACIREHCNAINVRSTEFADLIVLSIYEGVNKSVVSRMIVGRKASGGVV